MSYIGSSEKEEGLVAPFDEIAHSSTCDRLKTANVSERPASTYLQNWYGTFYPGAAGYCCGVAELGLAALQGYLEEPRLGWKYAWMKPVLGWKAAKWAQAALPQLKASCIRHCDKAMYRLETARAGASRSVESA